MGDSAANSDMSFISREEPTRATVGMNLDRLW